MSEKPETIKLEMIEIDGVREYKYKGVLLFETSKHRAFTKRTREEFIERVAAMQSELETLRAKSKAFDWMQVGLADINLRNEYLKSCLVEAQSLLEEKDEIEKDLKSLNDRLAASEHRVVELEALAKAVEDIENEGLALSHQEGASQWVLWNRLEAHGKGERTGFGNTIPAALADYREKHPEPGDDTSVTMAKYIIEHYDNEETLKPGGNSWHAKLVGMAHNILARERGDGHAD
jgi:hypothetical protein